MENLLLAIRGLRMFAVLFGPKVLHMEQSPVVEDDLLDSCAKECDLEWLILDDHLYVLAFAIDCAYRVLSYSPLNVATYARLLNECPACSFVIALPQTADFIHEDTDHTILV